MRDLGDSFGHGLAVFCEAAMDGVDWLLGSPRRVFGGENRGIQWLEKSGFSPQPLGRGSRENVPFENGGGYRIHWGKDGILQYHPGGFNHHGDQPYFKPSSGPTGTLWFDLFGSPIKKELRRKYYERTVYGKVR